LGIGIIENDELRENYKADGERRDRERFLQSKNGNGVWDRRRRFANARFRVFHERYD
jgi:hypothetical protein